MSNEGKGCTAANPKMRRSWFACRIAVALIFAISGVLGVPWTARGQPQGWVVSQFQPDIPNGGRANTIAVHPTSDSIMLVASSSGGLFRSVDALPQYATNAVTFLPADPKVLIVTTSEDYAASNGGGIWRSTDAGSTWTHIDNPPAPAGITNRFAAFGLAIAPDTGYVYAANNYGLAISADQGAHWNQIDPFGAGDRRVFSVTAQGGNRLIVAGPSGVRRSPDGGMTWYVPTTSPGGVSDMHALGRSMVGDQAYVVNGNTELFYTEDSGDHWTKIPSAPLGGGICGGIAFIKPVGHELSRPPMLQRSIELYFGNRCGLYRLSAPARFATGGFDYSGTWLTLQLDHGDTRDLAFTSSNQPLLLGTDGGLHKTADGGLSWAFVGGGRNGYNALQITEVRGQWVDDVRRHDLYFGTQDNNVYSSSTTGATWTSSGICCEGYYIEVEYHVATAADSQITFTEIFNGTCGHCQSGALFSNVAKWPDAPGATWTPPKIIGKSFHVQGIVNSGGVFSKGLAVTRDLGASWQQYAAFAEDLQDLPKLSWLPALLPARPRLPILYQSIRSGWDPGTSLEIGHLARIVKDPSGPGATVRYPMMNNFGGLGINPTEWAWYQVFAVDPGNANHLIAPDVINQKMMHTFDGGDNWTEIPLLTAQVTDNGRFLFRRDIFPLVSAINFFPDDPKLVALGTTENGIFISGDGGATWSKVPGSERVTYVTSFDWRTAQDVIVSSYGRGLWRVSYTDVSQPPAECRQCPHVGNLCDRVQFCCNCRGGTWIHIPAAPCGGRCE